MAVVQTVEGAPNHRMTHATRESNTVKEKTAQIIVWQRGPVDIVTLMDGRGAETGRETTLGKKQLFASAGIGDDKFHLGVQFLGQRQIEMRKSGLQVGQKQHVESATTEQPEQNEERCGERKQQPTRHERIHTVDLRRYQQETTLRRQPQPPPCFFSCFFLWQWRARPRRRRKKSQKRVRAHVNVFSPPDVPPPTHPGAVDWSKHFVVWPAGGGSRDSL